MARPSEMLGSLKEQRKVEGPDGEMLQCRQLYLHARLRGLERGEEEGARKVLLGREGLRDQADPRTRPQGHTEEQKFSTETCQM